MAGETKKLCFVIGPIGDEESEQRIHADWLYAGIIVPIFEKQFPNFRVERADKIPSPGMVSSQIITRLHEAELVIADLSFHNANSFYEMSIRHNVGKPIIHMIRKGERIPFDVIPHRAISFSNATPGDQEKARELLAPAVHAAIQPDFQADNPIMHALGKLELQKNASPEMKVVTDEISSLRRTVESLQSQIDVNRDMANFQMGVPPLTNLGRHSVTLPSNTFTHLDEALMNAEIERRAASLTPLPVTAKAVEEYIRGKRNK